MMEYDYSVEIDSTGMVTAEVFCKDGRRVGLKFYCFPFTLFFSLEKRCNSAHKWAKQHIEICKQQEVKSKFKAERK